MKIDHIALYCLDLAGMRQFFMKYFGCTSNEMYHNQGTGFKSYFLSFPYNDCRLEIMQRPEVKKELQEQHRAGFIHIAFAVGNKDIVDSKTLELTTAGYECVSGPRKTGDGYYESCIVGPEGILIEITA